MRYKASLNLHIQGVKKHDKFACMRAVWLDSIYMTDLAPRISFLASPIPAMTLTLRILDSTCNDTIISHMGTSVTPIDKFKELLM